MEQANYDKNTDKQNMEWKKYIYIWGMIYVKEYL